MKKILSIITFMLCMVTFASCGSDDQETENRPVEVIVASSYVNNPSGEQGLFMKVTFTESSQVKYVRVGDILGFDYQEGYVYRLLVKEMKVTNSQGVATGEVYYVLEKIISKTKDDIDPDNPLTPAE